MITEYHGSKTGQGNNSEEDKKLRARLEHIKFSTELLEYTMVALVSKLDTYMEERPYECRKANKEFTELLATVDETQSKTAALRGITKRLVWHIIKVMDLVDEKIGEAMKFVDIKRQHNQRRLQEVINQEGGQGIRSWPALRTISLQR